MIRNETVRRAAAVVIVVMVVSLVSSEAVQGRLSTAKRCKRASPELVAAIEAGVEEGLELSRVRLVKSRDFASVFFVSADLDGPGLEGGGDVGTWATNDRKGAGLVFSVSEVALEFSEWPDGGESDAALSMSDHGAERSARCAGA